MTYHSILISFLPYEKFLQPFAGIVRLSGGCEELLVMLFKLGDTVCGLILHRVVIVPQRGRVLN